MLTQERLKGLMSYDKRTGKFIRIWVPTGKGRNQCVVGEEVGFLHDGYLCTNIEGKHYKLHRLVMLYVTGSFPEKQVDHINGDKCDNSWKNLRCVDNSGNMKNQAIPKNNKSGCIGVCWDSGHKKWVASIGINKKCVRIGRYKHKRDAIKARKEAEKKYGYHKNHGRQKQ